MTWIRLNVGGEMMETSLATVTKYPDSQLAKMFLSVKEDSSNEDMETAETSTSSGDGVGNEQMYNIVYNIDCDPKSFKLILSWLRYGVVPQVSQDFDRRVLRGAAEHCGLDDLVKELISDNDNNNVKEKPRDNFGDKASSSMTDWLRLNVGGTIYETSRSTLTSDAESILARMFEPNSNLPPATVTEEGCYQIDACPRSFGVILNWLRYRSLIFGSDVQAEDVLPVADYFGLPELRTLLERHHEKETEKEGKIISCIEESVEKIEEVLQHVECEFSAINDKLEDFKVEMSTVASGMDDLWRLKCELSNISGILSNGFKNMK